MRTFFVIIALLVSAHAMAQGQPYALAGIGVAETYALGGSDPTTPAWIGGGYRSGPWAVEATYADLGSVDAVVSNGTTNLSSRSWSGKGLGVFALAHSGSFLVRAGAYRLRSEFSGESRSEDIWAPALSVGWQTQLDKHLIARASLEYVRGRGDFDSSRIIGTSLLYSF